MSAEVREPVVFIDYPLGDASADELVLEAAINSNTVANFTAFSGKEAQDGAEEVIPADAAALMGKAQIVGFSKRTEPDTTLMMHSGAPDEPGIRLRMFLTGPSYMMQTGRTRPAFSCVAESALIGNLKLDIYVTNTAREKGNKASMSEGTLTLPDAASSTNLAERFKELTEKMIEYWNKNAAGETGPGKIIKEQRHQINQEGPLDQWYELLDNSKENLEPTSEWLSVITRFSDGAANRSFNESVLGVLRGVSRDFQEVIDTLCDKFQLILIPSKDGGPGSFKLMEQTITASPKELVLPAQSMLLNGDVSHDLLPVQQVLALNLPFFGCLTALDPHKKKTDAGLFHVGGFPETAPAASGGIVAVPLPDYIQRAIQEAPNSEGVLPPDINSPESDYSSVKDLSVEYIDQLSKKFVEGWCRQVYVNTALGGSSTSITMPADLTLWPGERHKVVTGEGEEIFTGFLAGVQHTFLKGVGNQGQVTTVCNFTHIMFPGFKLEGMNT